MGIKKCDRRIRAGFTLAELLMVIAIIGVLVIAAIPGVVTLRDNLKMMELDAAARSIYVAAQNRMSELRASGQVSVLQGTKMSSAPSDFPDELEWSDGDYRYLTQSETGALLPQGAVDASLYNGNFYVEYNAKTGMVYGVFYAEENFTYQAELPREKPARKDHSPRLGYYGGSDIDYSKFEDSLKPDVELVNDEILTLTVLNTVNRAEYQVVIQDDEGNIAVFSFSGDGTSPSYMLDSRINNWQFKDFFPQGSSSYLVPGSNLAITVTVTVEGSYPASTSVTTNSLFATRDEERVTLSSGRHLQNLETAFSGIAENAGVTQAVQTGDITWPNENTTANFVSISSAELTSFNGNGNKITGLDAALFASFGDGIVENVRLTAPEIVTSNLRNAGTLVNEAQYTEFRNCVVYAEDETGSLFSNGAENTGGLVGLAVNCTFEQCSASLVTVEAAGTVSGSGIGGLVGKMEKGTVSSSYADTGFWLDSNHWDDESGIIANSGTAGGFLGVADGVEIENAYAGGNIRLASGSAAGFAGASRNASRYTSCYSVTTFEGTDLTVSPAGFAAAGTQNNCYFLKSTVSGSAADAAGASTVSELQTSMSGNRAFTAANEASTTPYGRVGEGYPYFRLSGMMHYGDWLDEAEEQGEMGNKLYYYERYSDGSYGYYGYAIDTLRSDLPVSEDGYVFLVQSGNSGAIKVECRAYPFTSGTSVNFNQPVIINFGGYTYKACFLRPNETIMNYATANTVTNQVVQITFIDKVNYTYYFNPNFAKSVSTSSTPPNEYIVRTARHLARLGALPNYANLSFVQERDIDFTTYGTAGNRPVLTPIKGNPQFKGTYDGKNYKIVSGSMEYTNQKNVGLFSYVNENAVLENIRFVAAHSGAVIAGGENTGGLVGLLEGATVQNCTVEGFDIRGTTRVGGLVGRNNKGTVQSSRAELCKVSATGDGLGGLVGLVESGSTVTNCFASGCEISGVNSVGGLIGHMTGGTVTNCGAANGYFEDQEANGGFVEATGSAVGGFIGFANGGTISNCYAVARLNFSTQTNGFFGTGWGIIQNCYSVALNGNDEFVSFSPAPNNAANVIAYNGYNFDDVLNLFRNNSNFGFASAANTHPYASSLQGRSYPFPTAVKNGGSPVHYGNWYLMSRPVGLFYFEQYSDGTYGFYGNYTDERGDAVNIDSLKNDLPVIKDGYTAAVYKGGGSTSRTTAPAYTWGTTNAAGGYQNAASPVSVEITFDGTIKDYDFYLLNDISSAANTNAQTAFYTRVRLTVDQTVSTHWFNPSFAKTVVSSTSQPAAPSNSTAVTIRTARQLSRLGQLNNYGHWARTYRQERDIDFAKYTSPAQTLGRIGTGSGSTASFSGTYDGGCHIITGAGISSGAQYVGLFGYNTGTLRNIVFKSDTDVTRTISSTYSEFLSSGSVGALVGYNEGNIANCAVVGFRVTGTSSSTLSAIYNQIGGLVGYNDGTITNSSAANAQMGNVLGGSVSGASRTNVGGFVGRNDSTISYCYAVGTIGSNGSRTGSFVGYTQGGTISYSYGATVNSSNNWITAFRDGSLGGTLTGCTAYNGSNLAAIQSNCTAARGFGTASATYSYGTAGNFPFPAIVKNADGEYVHYGNWRN